MRAIPSVLVPAALAAAVLAASAALAQQPPPRGEPTPQELLVEQADRVLRQLRDFLRTIPSYDPPVMTPEGDILIRRRPPRPAPGEKPYPPPGPEEPPIRL